VRVETDAQDFRWTLRSEQQGAVDLAGEETLRLAMPLAVGECLVRLGAVEDQLRAAVGDDTLGRGIGAVEFEKPECAQVGAECGRGRDFAVAEHVRRIADIVMFLPMVRVPSPARLQLAAALYRFR